MLYFQFYLKKKKNRVGGTLASLGVQVNTRESSESLMGVLSKSHGEGISLK